MAKLPTAVPAAPAADAQLAEALAAADEPVVVPNAGGRGKERDPPEVVVTYQVAQGKSITTKAGIKSDGAALTPDMLPGGVGRLDELASAGHVVRS